jgi:hypothetical protein
MLREIFLHKILYIVPDVRVHSSNCLLDPVAQYEFADNTSEALGASRPQEHQNVEIHAGRQPQTS